MTLAFLGIVPLSLLYIGLCLVLLPWRALRLKAGNVYGKLVGPIVFRLAGAKPVFENHEILRDSQPAMFVSNHTSTVDMWIGMWMCPLPSCGIAKKEIVRIPFFGLCYLLSGHLLVDRGNRAKAVASMKKAAAVVSRHGLNLWMWPEGTRSRDGRLRVPKKGFAHMAIAPRLPIVPVVFHDANKRWPGGTFRVTPGEVRIEILPPIRTDDWAPETG